MMSQINSVAAICTTAGGISCVDGFYFSGGACVACDAGKSCVINADCTFTLTNCANGEYSLDAETVCNPCPTGYTCATKTDPPVMIAYNKGPGGANCGANNVCAFGVETSCAAGEYYVADPWKFRCH